MSIILASNSWPGFQGFYSLFVDDHLSDFVYIINNIVYQAETLDKVSVYSDLVNPNDITNNYELVPPLNIDPNGSQLLAIQMHDEPIDLIYQQQSNGRFIELTNWGDDDFQHIINDVKILDAPLPNGIELNATFERMSLRELNTDIVDELLMRRDRDETISLNGILELLNGSLEVRSSFELFNISYEMLLKRLYNLPIIEPEYLIINNIVLLHNNNTSRINFTSFQEISQMLVANQIERYVIDPLLQPFTNPPNKVLTMYGKNGVTYLVKARYDQNSNQIMPPL